MGTVEVIWDKTVCLYIMRLAAIIQPRNMEISDLSKDEEWHKIKEMTVSVYNHIIESNADVTATVAISSLLNVIRTIAHSTEEKSGFSGKQLVALRVMMADAIVTEAIRIAGGSDEDTVSVPTYVPFKQ